ncbi:hypothetical protein H6A68_08760, partial [Bifidobacterium pullorum subsp. saeculare]|uniref:hypothetical protein n=1 Tax=Bifidobacterium pullorum TaxID=78448 RepID=UPI00195A9BB3
NLFNDEGGEKKNDAFHMSGLIATALSMKQITVMDIIEGHTVITDLADFCTVCQEVSGSVRLRDLNPVTLIGIVGGAWYGNNGRE